MTFSNRLDFFYSEEFLAPCPTPKLENYPLSAACNCLFSILPATLHIWRLYPPSVTQEHTMLWWQGPI